MSIEAAKILVEELKEGNEKAFELLFKHEFENAVYYANQFVRNELIARDIAQDSFIALWTSREKIESSLPINPYLFRIVRNRAINALRDKVAKAAPIDVIEFNCDLEILKDENLISGIDASRLERLISDAYETLPLKVKDSFVLSRIEGMSYEAIAKKRGIQVKAVEYHIMLALKHFRKKLKSHMYLFLLLIIS